MKYLFVWSCLLSLISCTSQSIDTTSKEQKTESDPQIIKSEKNDDWNNNIYTNSFYKFKIEFPKGWEYDNGASHRTLARAGNRSLGITFSVQVIPVPNGLKDPNDIWNSLNDSEMIESVKIENESEMFKDLSNLNAIQGYLSNKHAYLVSFNHIVYSQQRKIEYIVKRIMCFKLGNIFQITFISPVIFIDEEMNIIYDRVIGSFLLF